jgi:rhamnose utilization protein RhaD (predicted bifunctional aldolase and dehydrogenase)/NAD(P)-dependent dehydrogenase (short-subunit alcohol dehydrogenase family)
VKSLWSERDARAAVQRYADQGVGEDLALRTYSARLLGREPRLVLHGGGNTSVKTRMRDVFGEDVEVLCVKGSGWDLASIEPAGHPAVRLGPLMRLRGQDRLSDEDMVSAQRQCLLDPSAPNPSVETLLHAFIGEKFVDHTHSTAVLALADQPDAAVIFEDIFRSRTTSVDYVMPGFDLAKAAGDAYDRKPGAEGLVLLKHGVFSFGPTARGSYERMISLVSAAEDYIASKSGRTVHAVSLPRTAGAAEVLPVLRGALARAAGDDWPSRWLLDLREGETARAVCDDKRLEDWARRGVATPDHVIRTKAFPLVTSPPEGRRLDAWGKDVSERMERYGADYVGYFARNDARCSPRKTQLDPLPRVLAVPGLGLIGVGKSAAEAAVAADIAESWAGTLLDAEAVGRFEPVGEADTFDMEYWSLEQAKLGSLPSGGLRSDATRGANEKRLARRVAVVTGGGGAIGAAVARAFAAEGCELAVLDLDLGAAERTAGSIGGRAVALGCDVTRPEAIAEAFNAIARRFGGVDIVVSNAGAALTGAMAELPDERLRASFDLNFFAHQEVAKAAVRVLRAQGMGGILLFNVSKQAVNPGPDFGAYGTSKAALLALVRQYALELGPDGVRCNGVNADRIRSGLLTEQMIRERAASRGLTTEAYMSGNLLGREVLAEDVAQAFVFAALMQKTTGAILPVDGGNVAAMLR